MYNIRLYPLAFEHCWVFNMLIACIPLIFKFHDFESFNFHSIHVGLRVKGLIITIKSYLHLIKFENSSNYSVHM